MSVRPRAVVLLSGGLDSTTVLALAAAEGRETYALSFGYGQRHAVELECARRQAARLGARAHEVVDLGHVGRLVAAATSLVKASPLAVPKDSQPDPATIPSTYVPARNTLFLAYALGWAEALDAREIWLGVNALDYSGYPDCRPEFIAAFQQMARLGTTLTELTVHTPLAALTKRGIVERGLALGVDFSLTRTCYDPDASGAACGHCDACQLRLKGFRELGLEDPAPYADL